MGAVCGFWDCVYRGLLGQTLRTDRADTKGFYGGNFGLVRWVSTAGGVIFRVGSACLGVGRVDVEGRWGVRVRVMRWIVRAKG